MSTIEDKGYEVTFRGGQVIMYPKGSSVESGKAIEIRLRQTVQVWFSISGGIGLQWGGSHSNHISLTTFWVWMCVRSMDTSSLVKEDIQLIF